MTTYDEIVKKCSDLGISVSELCREAKVDRSVLERWKKREPKTIRTLRAFEAVMASKRQYMTMGEAVTVAAADALEAIKQDATPADAPIPADTPTADGEDKWL